MGVIGAPESKGWYPIRFFIVVQPSGKARDFDSRIRWFEPNHDCHSDTYSKYICYLGSILIYIAFVKSVQQCDIFQTEQVVSTRVFQKPSCSYAGVAQLVEQLPWGGRLRVSPFRLKPKEITVQICSSSPVSSRSGVQVRPPAPLFDLYYNLCYNIYIKQALTAIFIKDLNRYSTNSFREV